MVSYWLLIPRRIVLEVWRRNGSRWLMIHFPPETQVASDLPHLHPAEAGWREIRRLSLHAQSLGYSSLILDAYRSHHGSFKNCLCLGRLRDSDLMSLGCSLGIGSFKSSLSDSTVNQGWELRPRTPDPPPPHPSLQSTETKLVWRK